MGSGLGHSVGFRLRLRVYFGFGHRVGFGLAHRVDAGLGYKVVFFGLIIGWTLG